MPISIRFADLVIAFEWVGSGGGIENTAYISRATGQIHWASDGNYLEEPLPDDIDEPGLYLDVPQKNDLDLGNRLVYRFAEDHLPDLYQDVRDIFRRKGAYSRFKDLLVREGQLDAWYQYEEKATETALRAWCQVHELQVDP